MQDNLSVKVKIDQLPKKAGVYLFYEGNPSSRGSSGRKNPVYIGKAINIRDRVKNHFNQPSYRDNLFISKVDKIGFIETDSEIEALILEASLIKKHLPKFNVVWRDDKNYFYVAIAQNQQKIPYIYITHQFKIQNSKFKIQHVGPFVEGNALKKTLKFLRKVFPYYTSVKHPKQKCTWCHLDLCPGPNPDLKEYKKNIKKLILILKGKRKNVLSSLKKEMKAFSYSREYENAKKARDKIYALELVMAHTHVIENQNANLKSQNDVWIETQKILQDVLNIKKEIHRIECYDISNIQGKNTTGSMVVFISGSPERSQYKKFKIRIESGPNDIAMLKEVLERRFSHPEWKYPEIILIDGGKAQLNVAIKVRNKLQKAKSNPYQKTRSSGLYDIGQMKKSVLNKIQRIKIISIAKGRQELFIENPPSRKTSEGQRNQPIPLKNLPQDIYNLIKHLDDEAHRFAITYHKKLRKKALGIDNNETII